MKHCFLVLASVLLLTNCTRKQNLRELEHGEKIAEHPQTCYNGIKDGDETFTDCGGSCGPCPELAPSCVATNNLIEMSANSTNSYSYAATVHTSTVSTNGKFTFSGSFTGGGNYTIVLGTSVPNVTAYYSITSTSSPATLGANEAIVDINPPSTISLNECIDGKVFISQVSGVYYATICEATAWSNGWSTMGYAIKGKVSGQ